MKVQSRIVPCAVRRKKNHNFWQQGKKPLFVSKEIELREWNFFLVAKETK